MNWSLGTTKHGKILCCFLFRIKLIEIKSVLISVKGFLKKMIINIYAIFTYCRSCYKAVFLDLLILFLLRSKTCYCQNKSLDCF